MALGLAMDAFAVSVGLGGKIMANCASWALTIGMSFGLFQALMPILGYISGKALAQYLKMFDHWIAFILILFVGIRIIFKSSEQKKGSQMEICPWMIFLLSIATSIDALAVGFTLPFLRVSLLLPVIIIGGVTFLLSTAGVFAGKISRKLAPEKCEFVGGFILILIGFKILFEHLGLIHILRK